jgi:hypothetical protein
MKVKFTMPAAVALMIVVAPGLLFARSIELTPYGGYKASSALSGTSIELRDGTTLDDIDFESGATFGLLFNYRLENRLLLEVNAEGFPTKLKGVDRESGAKSEAFELVMYYLQLGLEYEVIEYGVSAEEVKIRPFIFGGLGSTWFNPAGDRKGNARFNVAFAVGFKFMFNERLGLRTQGRYVWTYMNASNEYFCTGDGTGYGQECTVFPTSESLSQIDLTVGLIITL